MKRQKKQAYKQAKEETREIVRACKEHTQREPNRGKQSMLSM